MEERRVGPLAQLIWDLSTIPSLRTQFASDPQPILAERGLDESVLPAIQGDSALLVKLLTEEEERLDATHGPLPEPQMCRLVWCPGEDRGTTA